MLFTVLTSKFIELAPILTSRGASLAVKGKVYKACVQRVLVYGSETWPIKVEDMQKLEDRKNDGKVDVWRDSEKQNIECGIV